MLDVLKPFIRILMAVPVMFSFGYLSFFTPYRLLHGEGFTPDLQMALVTIGFFAGLLYFSRPKIEAAEVDMYTPGGTPKAGEDSEPPKDPPASS